MSVYVFPHIVKDCPKIRKIFLRSSENMAPGHMTSAHRAFIASLGMMSCNYTQQRTRR